MRFLMLVMALATGCGTEVVRMPPAPCDQAILDGSVDSDDALAITDCLNDAALPLLALEGSGATSDGALARWDVTVLGQGVVLSVGLAEGLRAGSAEYSLEEIFGPGGCTTPIARPANSSDVVPHALATLGLDEEAIDYRSVSDCLTGGTAGRVVVAKGSDRLIYSSEGKLVESCLECLAGDLRECCGL